MSLLHRGQPSEAILPTGHARPLKGQDDGAELARLVIATDAASPLDVNLVVASGTTLLRTDKDTLFTDALAVNAFENENLVGLPANIVRVKSVVILSVQRLGWELQFYGRDTFQNADADLDQFQEAIEFALTDGQQIAAAGLFRYAMTGLDIPIQDLDASLELHLALGTRQGAKLAGAPGEVVVLVAVEA